MKLRRLYTILSLLFILSLTSCLASKQPDPNNYNFMDMTCVFDGNSHSIELEGKLPSGYDVKYIGNGRIETGMYPIIAQVYESKTGDIVFTLGATLTILPPETGIIFDSEKYIYDGESHIIEVDGLKDNDEYYVLYENNEGIEVGKYYSKAYVYTNDNLLAQTLQAIMIIDNPQNNEFEEFMDEFLVMIFEDDQMSINFFFNNPEHYGLKHYDAILSKYDKSISYEDSKKEIEQLIEILYEYDYNSLNQEEKITYEIVERYLNYVKSITEEMSYMSNKYFGSYLGLQSNLPIELAEYKFRNEQDIKDFISYMESAPLAFASYLEFTTEQIKYGYAMPDFVIDNVVNQCEEFVALGEDNFLIEIFNQKIDEITFQLVENKIDEYKKLVKAVVVGPLTDAYRLVLEELPKLKGQSKVYGGLAMYGEIGQEYYMIELLQVLGLTDVSGYELYDYLNEKFEETYNELMKVVNQYQSLKISEMKEFVDAIMNGYPNYSAADYDELVVKFREYANEIVPEIEEMPEISIKEVPDSLKGNFSPAAYFVSPIDETKYESIYLNPLYLDDYNYIFTTLAHEGYPGHLYQNVYTKTLDINDVRKALRCSGYVEGWATYVEQKAYYFADTYTSKPLKLALQYNQLNSKLSLIMNAILDLGIHYFGYTINEFTTLVNNLTGNSFTSNDAEIIASYNQLVEIPTNMSMYTISFLILDDLHDYAQEALGTYFDEVEFNEVLLNDGAAPLDIVIDNVKEYVKDKLFITRGLC